MKIYLSAIILFISSVSFCQTRIHTEDIFNFYTTFDAVQLLSNKEEQINIIQKNYIEKGSDGLRSFVALGGSNAEKWRYYMIHHRNYLMSIRSSLETIDLQIPLIQKKIDYLKSIYRNYREGEIYFLVGVGLVGGTPDYETNSLLLFGEMLATNSTEWAIPSTLHEFVHLQQQTHSNPQLLTQTIHEGVAEFLSENLYGKDLAQNGFAPHILFGREHEKKIWVTYKEDMLVLNNGYLGWLYGLKNINNEDKSDLGYFIGYQICRTFFEKSNDKNQAITELLTLDLSSNEKILDFVLQSGYVSEKEKTEFVGRKFETSIHQTEENKVVIGYEEQLNSIDFIYTLPDDFLSRLKIPIVSVSVAGSFNGWNPLDEQWKMTQLSKKHFKLSVAKNTLKGKNAFKFVLNDSIWMPVPSNANNVDTGNNLIIQVE